MISLLQRNLLAKVIALLVATVLWFFIMNDQNPSIEGSFTVPLNIVNAPEGYKITHNVDEIKIKVRGPRSLFVAVTESEFKAYVDLNGIVEGKQSVKVQTVLPAGFELVETLPETLTFNIDKIVQRQVKAEVVVTGLSAPGTTVAKVTPALSNVMIEGPSASVSQVTRVVGYVSLAGNNADFDVAIPLTAVNADGKEVEEVKVVPQTEQVSVALARGLSKKIVSIKPIVGSDLAANYVLNSIKVDPSKIEIAGEAKLIESLNEIDTEKILLKGFTKATKKDVKLELPPGITVTNGIVSVIIDIAEKK
jgi:YbbR domain-containing protein